MTSAPADLLVFRQTVMQLTGLTGVAVGIVGDSAHAASGGYHEGRDDLARVGRYHVGAHAGATTEDYSVRLQRDRNGLTDNASAIDVGYQWPRGGNAAWLRFNNTLVAALRGNDPALAAVRAVNYSPDGSLRRRVDRQNGFAVEMSGDSVDIHTHVEFYRDTEGRRQATFDRLAALIQAAITGPAPATEEDDMGASFPPFTIYMDGATSLTIPPVEGGAADPRQAWLSFCNDTNGADYTLRVWVTKGDGGYAPLWGTDGFVVCKSGVVIGKQLPAGTRGITISRQPTVKGGPVYAGDLTGVIERGPVVRPA